MSTRSSSSSARTGDAGFAATRWSVVLAAAEDPAGTNSRRALEELAQIYWFPLYAFIRRQGSDPHQAEDLTQEFFSRLLEKKSLAGVDRAKGKFRSFLVASLEHFLADQRDKARALKRGGGQAPIALDALEAEARYALEPADRDTPQRLFERRWALAVLERVLAQLEEEYRARNQAPLFEALAKWLSDEPDMSTHAQAAAALGMTPGAVKVAVHRLRRRYRELLRQEIAQTVASPDQVQEEIAYLLSCL